MDNKVSYFDIINIIQTKNIKWESLSPEEKKAFNIFMINRSLSMNPDYIDIINFMQKYSSTLTKEEIFNLYSSVLPKKKTYNKFIKGINEKKYTEDLVLLISNYFECNKRESIEYIDTLIITKQIEELKKIIGMYGKDEKEIKKILEKNIKK